MKLLKKIKKWFSTLNEEKCYICGKTMKASRNWESIKIVLGYSEFEYLAFDSGKEQKLPWKFYLCKQHRKEFEKFMNTLKAETQLKKEKNGEFTCCLCKETYIKNLSEEEARAQFKEEFPNLEFNENMPLFCEDCFRSISSMIETKNITKEMIKEIEAKRNFKFFLK